MPRSQKAQVSVCICDIALKGDKRTIVNRGFTNPVTWPELRLIAHLHGKNAVTGVTVIGEQAATQASELARLRSIYGDKAIEFVYPGAFPDIQMKAPLQVPRGEASKPPAAEDLADDLDLDLFGDPGDEAAA